MATEIRVPTLGESVSEATVGQWFKAVGDTVAVDEPLVELETEKITLEVPAPAAGVIEAIDVEGGATVGVGALLGTIKADGTAAKAEKTKPAGVRPVRGEGRDGQAGRCRPGAGRATRGRRRRRGRTRCRRRPPPRS